MGAADVDVVQDFALANRTHLRRQFALYRPDYRPDYVVGCGSGVAEILFGDVYERRTDWASTSKGIRCAGFGASPDDPPNLSATYFAYWYPNVRWPANLVHYGLVDAVAEVGVAG